MKFSFIGPDFIASFEILQEKMSFWYNGEKDENSLKCIWMDDNKH